MIETELDEEGNFYPQGLSVQDTWQKKFLQMTRSELHFLDTP
jgi:hypothetical protein